jgi:hypothetical protein
LPLFHFPEFNAISGVDPKRGAHPGMVSGSFEVTVATAKIGPFFSILLTLQSGINRKSSH